MPPVDPTMPNGDRVYVSTNNIGTATKYVQGTSTVASTYEGLCRALSVLWCANMVAGVADTLTQPNNARAASIQWWYERNSSSKRAFELAEVKGLNPASGQPSAMLAQISGNVAPYLISLRGHSVAAAVRLGTQGQVQYFYDPDGGLYKYNDVALWKADILARYSMFPTWDIWKVAKA